jgi:hypothetical protein
LDDCNEIVEFWRYADSIPLKATIENWFQKYKFTMTAAFSDCLRKGFITPDMDFKIPPSHLFLTLSWNTLQKDA